MSIIELQQNKSISITRQGGDWSSTLDIARVEPGFMSVSVSSVFPDGSTKVSSVVLPDWVFDIICNTGRFGFDLVLPAE